MSKVKKIIVRPNQLTRRLPCRLTPEELDQRVKEHARTLRDQREQEAHYEAKKAEAKTAKEGLDYVNGRLHISAETITTQREMRQIELDEVFDFDGNMVWQRRTDTGQMVDMRQMTTDERQLSVADVEVDGDAMSEDELREAVSEFFQNHPEKRPKEEKEEADGD